MAAAAAAQHDACVSQRVSVCGHRITGIMCNTMIYGIMACGRALARRANPLNFRDAICRHSRLVCGFFRLFFILGCKHNEKSPSVSENANSKSDHTQYQLMSVKRVCSATGQPRAYENGECAPQLINAH